jgi:hypothetical protein
MNSESLRWSGDPMREDRQTEDRPQIRPGQICVLEPTAATRVLAHHRGAVAGPDVVLYDRTLAPLVPGLLPPGGYAEPIAADADDLDLLIAPRALKLAADGWSVVQLIARCRGWRRRLRRTTEQLGPLNGFTIQLIAKTATAQGRSREVSLPDPPELVEALAEDEILTLIVGPLAGSLPAAARASVGNGLAG